MNIQGIIREIITLGSSTPASDAVHIVVGIDKKYARPMGVLMTSIFEHTEGVALHIFADELENQDEARIRAMAARFGVHCVWYVVSPEVLGLLPTTRAWTIATYFRFVAGEYFCGKIPRILYLDSDMLCLRDIRPLFAIDMKGKAIAAVKDEGLPPGRLERIGHKGDGYFNAGMLLIDLAQWCQAHSFDRAMALLLEDPKRYTALDQDVLNLIFENKVLWLDKKFNYCNNVRDEYPEDTVLVHYTATPKPWLAWYFCSGANLWAQTAARSEWRDVPRISVPQTTRETRLMSRSSFQRGEMWQGIVWYMKYLKCKLHGKKVE